MSNRAGRGVDSPSSTVSKLSLMMSSGMSLRSSKHQIKDHDTDDCLTENEKETVVEQKIWLCAECGKNLTTDKTSLGCDFEFCNRWYHPSCLLSIPPEDQDWLCHLCQPDRISPKDKLQNSSNQPKVDTGQIKCLSCKRKVDQVEYITCSGKCSKQFHGDCFLSEEEKEKYFVNRSNDNWYCGECVSFLQGAIK